MKKSLRIWIRMFPVFLLMPYLVTILFNGSYMALVNHMPEAETLVPAMTAVQIAPEREPEMLKTQSIIARTNLYRRWKRDDGVGEILKEIKEKLTHTYKDFLFAGEVYERAARETKDQVLSWKGELALAPYHELSSGKTRDGAEAFCGEAYTYLKSVDSSMDKNAAGYLSSSYAAATQMPQVLKIAERDSAGYITSLCADGRILEGEAFRQGMGLSSADFSIQKVGEQFRFLSKGHGHGLGISQYGGNILARDGAACGEILEAYFPELEIVDIHSIFVEK